MAEFGDIFGDLLSGKGGKTSEDYVNEFIQDAAIEVVIEDQISQWLKSKPGQHQAKCGRDVKGDLIRFNANNGLPTIREDYADKIDKIEVRSKPLLGVIRERLDVNQRQALARLAPK